MASAQPCSPSVDPLEPPPGVPVGVVVVSVPPALPLGGLGAGVVEVGVVVEGVVAGGVVAGGGGDEGVPAGAGDGGLV